MSALLSEHWHAVRALRPSLRDGVQALHRRLRGRTWVLLFDPISQRFHRVTPQVWRVLSLLDGRRTLDEVWELACQDEGADADASRHACTDLTAPVTQTELVQLMSTLHANDLLRTQITPDAGEMRDRHERQAKQRFRQGWLNPMSMRLPLLHPDAWFDRQAALARALFTWPVLLMWLALTLPAAVLAWQHWPALTENLSDRVLSASNLALLWLIYPIVKAVHEWAHGIAVKAWGGNVREMGIMFILFTPVPYVDASASYRFTSKWARAAVAAAGIMAELALGAVALYVWLSAQPGLVTAVAFNVVLIAGVSTLMINGNPLMRYDGYFILCDLLELPNLAQRAKQYRAHLLDKFLFGAREAMPPAGVEGERGILLLYGLLAPIYQFIVAIGIVWFVAAEYLAVGVVMALVTVWTSLLMPWWRGWKHLRESASLAGRRDVAMRRTLWLAGGLLAFLALVPMPFHTVHHGVVWLPDAAIVRAQGDGHVADVWQRPGDRLDAGQPLLHLDSPKVLAELGDAAAAVAHATAALRKAEVTAPAEAEALRQALSARQSRLDEAAYKARSLDVVAGARGHWAPAVPTELAGRHVRRGEVLGYVVDGPSNLVRVAVTQEDMELIRSRLQGVAVRLAHAPDEAVRADLQRQVPGGAFDLVSPALGSSAGGDIAVDPAQDEGKHSLQRVFDLEVALRQPSAIPVFGDRAYVRFDLGPTPLLMQWSLRLRQVFLARLAV